MKFRIAWLFFTRHWSKKLFQIIWRDFAVYFSIKTIRLLYKFRQLIFNRAPYFLVICLYLRWLWRRSTGSLLVIPDQNQFDCDGMPHEKVQLWASLSSEFSSELWATRTDNEPASWFWFAQSAFYNEWYSFTQWSTIIKEAKHRDCYIINQADKKTLPLANNFLFPMWSKNRDWIETNHS